MHMVTEELLNFVRAQFMGGMHPDEIERLLVGEGGWDKNDVEEAMTSLGLITAPSSLIPEKPAAPSVATSSFPPPQEKPEEVLPAPSSVVVEPAPPQEVPPPLVSENLDVVLTPDVAQPETSSPAKSEGEVHEDFLGIFANTEASPTPQPTVVTPPAEITPPVQSFDLSRVVTTPSAPSPTTAVEVQATAPTFTTPSPAESPVASIVVPPSSSPVNPAPVDSGFRLNLSALDNKESVPSVTESVAPAQSDPVLGKTIETKSVAEAWLQGARESKASTDADALASAPGAVKENKPAIHRTMGSDILLRGTGAAIAGVPSLLPQEEKLEEPPVVKATPPAPEKPKTPVTPLAEDLMRRNKIKKILLITIGVIAVLGVLAGAVLFFMKTKAPDKGTLFDTVLTNFLASSAFAYKGEGMLDLGLSVETEAGAQNGVMKFALAYGGALQNTPNGYGDGIHRVNLKGGLQSGEFMWSTDIDTDIKVVGNTLYFHVLALPDSADMDPDVLQTYWIQVNLSDIAKELALNGVAAAEEGYGNFGGSSADTSFNALIKKSMPFTAGDLIEEQGTSGSVLHYALKADPDRMIELVSLLSRKYMNKDLVLTDEKKLRLKDALAKMTGDVWVNSETGTLMKLTISGNFDDEMFDMHVKGPMALSFDFSDFNKAVTTSAPTPVLTLEELQTRTADYKKVKEKRARDQVKLDRLSFIKDALALYYDENKKYPATLTQLEQSGKLATSSVDSIVLKQYAYAAYIKDGVFTKAGRCTTKGKTCEFYHLGINLDDVMNPVLEGDIDHVDDVLGSDVSGCAGETDVACYDITPAFGQPLLMETVEQGSSTATTSPAM